MFLCHTGAALDAQPVRELHPLGGPQQGGLQDCRLRQGGGTVGETKGKG